MFGFKKAQKKDALKTAATPIGKNLMTAESGFDEAAYLEAHPDIAAAIDRGVFSSGFDHYQRHGWSEGRSLGRPRVFSGGLPKRPDVPGGSQKSTGAFIMVTMVYNEGPMLRRWVEHYSRQLGRERLLVIDHGSDDGSTSEAALAGVSRLTLPRSPYDNRQRIDFFNGLQASLLQYHEVVMFSDCDEFLVADPRRYKNLREYLEQKKDDCIRATGLNVMHVPSLEPDLDQEKPLLGQRRHGYFHTPECKPLVARMPQAWEVGLHDCGLVAAVDPELLLIHARFADQKSALRRLAITRNMAWSERNLALWSHHQRADDAALEKVFKDRDEVARNQTLEPICPKTFAASLNAEMQNSTTLKDCPTRQSPFGKIPDWLIGAV